MKMYEIYYQKCKKLLNITEDPVKGVQVTELQEFVVSDLN